MGGRLQLRRERQNDRSVGKRSRRRFEPTLRYFVSGPPTQKRGETMPLVPHYPTDEPKRDRRVPDIDEIVDDILGSGDDPQPVVG